MKRIQDNQKPPVILRLGNNKYYYNYNIEKEEYIDEEGNLKSKYNYIQVKLSGIPNYKDCVKSVIREYISESEEFDLINSANRITLGLTMNKSAYDKYTEYLKLVDKIKQTVKEDFDGLDI